MSEEKYEIVKFIDGELELDINVNHNDETIWLNQTQIALLFCKSKSTINEHIKNILEKELDEKDVVRKFGKTELSNVKTKPILFYNLDLVLAVGYKVNSKKGIEFRKWANKVLKEYLLKGYVINANRTNVTEDNFNKQYEKLEVKYTTKVHDRYIIIDQEKLYHLGYSIKDLGKKICSISESDSLLIKELLKYLMEDK